MARRKSRTEEREERKPRHVSVAVIALALVILAVMGWRLNELHTQLETARFERDRYLEQVAEMEEKNAALSADIEEGVTEEKIEEIARNDFNMVLPGEYVFYNTGNTTG